MKQGTIEPTSTRKVMNPIYLPEESSQRLRGLAELTGETITRIGQVAIERYLDQVSATVRPQS